MKILRINICNLNSLVGNHTIDFSTEPLRSAGLYAIVGPTGSGKSTVLDAITLALYGRTERDTYGAEVMSHGTGECFAEVIFETGEGTFLSRWERRRARQRPDGNLQTAQLQLSRLDTREEEFKPLPADRLNEVKELTKETIGLDYDQFVRSVMLTQGQFARFLASTTKERADILEKITGTWIYSQISQSAFERHKLARENYDRLRESQRHLLPLSEEERTAFTTTLTTLQERISHLRPRQNELRRQADLYKQVKGAETRKKERQADLKRSEEAWESVKPLRDSLEASLRLGTLREPLTRYDATLREEREASIRLDKQRADLKARTASLILVREAASKANARLAALEKEKPVRLQKLSRAASLETQLSVRHREAATEAPQIAGDNLKYKRLKEELKALESREALIRKSLQGQEPTDIANATTALEERLDRLVQQRAYLAEWRQRLELESRWERVKSEKARTDREFQDRQSLHTAALEQLTGATAKFEGRRRILTRLEKTKGLEPLRNELAEGDPCPLCGATHHPALEDDMHDLDEDLRTANKDLQQAERALKETQSDEREAAKLLTQAETRVEEASKKAKEVIDEMRVNPPPGKRPAGTLAEVTEEWNSVSRAEAQAQEQLRKLRELRKAATELNQLLPQLEIHRTQLAERRKSLESFTQRAEQREVEIKSLQNERRELIGGDSVEEARGSMERAEAKRRADVAAREKEVQQAIAEERTATELEADRREKVSQLSQSKATVLATIESSLRDLEVSSVDAAKQQLLTPELENEYREKTKALQLELHSRRDAARAAERELEAARGTVRGLPTIEELDAALSGVEQEIEELNREQGSVRKELQQDDERRFAYGVLVEELERAEKDRYRWARLNDLIGQKDGVKFSRFAQTLTLQRLVEVGNRHLQRINERYRMRHRAADDMSRENLELEIIDTFQNDNRRPMTTLSGGETFIVSLALALGLSELASGRTNIQSLFIDEGFGTLDEKILDDAVSALEQLQGQGKTIGLISHVKELRERIHCQIRLEPRGSGRSQLFVTPSSS